MSLVPAFCIATADIDIDLITLLSILYIYIYSYIYIHPTHTQRARAGAHLGRTRRCAYDAPLSYVCCSVCLPSYLKKINCFLASFYQQLVPTWPNTTCTIGAYFVGGAIPRET